MDSTTEQGKPAQIFNQMQDQSLDVEDSINSFLRENYLKNSNLNFEKNQDLPQKLVESLSIQLGPQPRFQEMFAFLKNGLSKVEYHASVTSGHRVHDGDLHFREFYNLKDFDIIDESEEIATHLISELNGGSNSSVF